MNVLVTGCSGFIGSHVMRAAPSFAGLDMAQPGVAGRAFVRADIRDRAALRSVDRADAVVHLAAMGEVLIPWEQMGSLYETNVQGTYNVLDVMDPGLLVLASSSSVYGDTEFGAARLSSAAPVGAYGMTKAACELLCVDWARERGRAAVAFRIGNVVGARCRGLVRYLVQHALEHPEGRVAAQLRGGGRLVRDYIPVSLVVKACLAAVSRQWDAGLHIVNLATGRGMTNADVLEIARGELMRLGYRLSVEWSADPGPGEATTVVLDPTSLQELPGVVVPSEAEVVSAVEDAVREGIAAANQEARNACFANA